MVSADSGNGRRPDVPPVLPRRLARRNVGRMVPPRFDPFIPLQEALKGRYSLQRELGRGGMGIVYLAHEVVLDRPVALKLLPPELAQHRIWGAQFLREARTAAKLSHPSIVPIHAVEEAGEFVFFTMAYVDGETLAERIKRAGRLSEAEAARVLWEVAAAAAYAHAEGVIHRDLKAENVMLERKTGRVFVLDFGIAQLAAQPRSGGFEIVGTPAYIAPELVRGAAPDPRSDVYSLGVLAFYAASGRLPFRGQPKDVLIQQVTRPAAPLARVVRGVNGKFAELVDRCLSKDPDKRFQTAEEFASAVFDAVPAEPGMHPLLRTFVDQLRATSRTVSGAALAAAVFFSAMVSALIQRDWVGAVLPAGLMLVSLAFPIAKLWPTVRDVATDDKLTFLNLLEALRADVDRRTEALANRNMSAGEWWFRRIAYVGAAVHVLGWLAVAGGLPLEPAVFALGMGGALGMTFGALAIHRHQQRIDLVGQRWLRFWESRLGPAVMRHAGMRFRRLPAGDAGARLPAETSIVHDIDRLYDALPPAVRRALGNFRSEVRRLEANSLAARQWIAELEADLARAAGAAPAGLEEQRDRAQRTLGDSVTAMESLRLELLRWEQGAATPDSIAEHLQAAREIGEAVDQLLQARREVGEG